MSDLVIGLVHYPVLGPGGDTVTSAITSLDVHDLARSARTYGARECAIVHPISAQRELVSRIVEHWTSGSSALRIPSRKEALLLVRTYSRLDDLFERIGGRRAIRVWITAARSVRPPLSWADARRLDREDGRPLVILFGTGWGLAQPIVELADAALPPLHAEEDAGYNHLSVRAACAITLDRLRG